MVGQREVKNLFHSFRELNVSEGRSAYFLNPVIISEIS